ncbi:MAG: CPBP family intramembrane metalloprotease [Paludibacteraceae bacterium]|nr:CPBP family intramembrane metalloprotease [Paludibacteraceae bacterium]
MFKIKGLFAGSSNWVKLLVTLLIPLFLLCLTSVIWALIIEAAGVDVTSLNVERAVQFISSVITFIVGGVSVAYLIFENPKEELMMSSWGGGKNYLYGIIALLALLPIVGVLNEWNQGISFPDALAPLEQWMREAEDAAAELQERFLSGTSYLDLIINIVIMAITPAICEELLFRGVLQNQLEKWFKNAHIAVWVAAIIFSAIHFQFYGFLPRMVLGAALGYLLVYGKSLWLPIVAHCVNNSLAVITAWGANKLEIMKEVEAVAPTYTTSEDYIFLIGCVFVVALSYYKLYYNNSQLGIRS